MKKLLTASSFIFAVPFVAFAANSTAGTTFTNIITDIDGIVTSLVPIMITAALVAFFWGLVRYIMKSGGAKAQGAKNLMIWALIALFVMVSVWGIIRVVQNTLGTTDNNPIGYPTVN